MPFDQSFQILAVAMVTYAVIQVLKRWTPNLCGKHAVAMNVVLTAIGAWMTARPQTWSDAIMLVLSGSAAAAGIHGTVRSFGGDPRTAADGSARVAPALVLAMLLGTLGLTGCHRAGAGTPSTAPTLAEGAVNATDAASNRALQTAHAFAYRLTADSKAGKLYLSVPQRAALGRLNAALNTADVAEQSYHSCAMAAQEGTTSLPACDTAQVINAVALVQQLFADAELALTPTH